MTSSRPYLIRAIYDWLFDNSMTVFIAVDATNSESEVPAEHVKDGQIVLDISPEAVRDLDLANDYISFNARFSGKLRRIIFPVAAVLAVYSAENGRGMIFGQEDPLSGETSPDPAKSNSDQHSRQAGKDESKEKSNSQASHLRVVKFDSKDKDSDSSAE